MNKQEIRKYFLENSNTIIESLLKLFTEPETATLNSMQQEALKLIWPTLHQIIINAGDLEIIQAKNASELIALIQTGNVSISEGRELMTLFQRQMEIEEVPKLLAALEKIEE